MHVKHQSLEAKLREKSRKIPFFSRTEVLLLFSLREHCFDWILLDSQDYFTLSRFKNVVKKHTRAFEIITESLTAAKFKYAIGDLMQQQGTKTVP